MHDDNLPPGGKPSVRERLRRLSLREALLLVALVEAISWSATRITLQHFAWDTYTAEALRSALRCATALVFWLLMRQVITARQPDYSAFRGQAFSSAVLLFLMVPLVLPHPAMETGFAWFFGLMALPVGVKEELLFRGLLQNLLNLRMGQGAAVLLSATLATLWHAGAVEHAWWSYVLIFLANAFLGVVYGRTGNLLLVIGLHAGYDALFALPSMNLFRYPLPIALCMMPYVVGMACHGWEGGRLRLPRTAAGTA